MFSVRLVNADSYQATPLPQLDPTFSEFRGTEIKHVPIVRVFGTTHTGEKTCLHLHGVFPYLYVPFTGDDNADGLAYRLAASLDAAINISLGSANSNTQHVYQVQRVAGIPFYGYHRREHQFFKVSFYNPAIMKKAIDLLQNGSVLNQSFQPHEAHIPFILQFMMDYNLHGMSMINLSSVKYRRRITQSHSEFKSSNAGSSNSSNSSGGVATTGGIITPVDELDYLPACVERQSICELEVDGLVSDILNRQDLERGIELNPGLAAIWEEERARRAQAGLACEDSQLVNPKSPGRPPYCLTDNDLYQQQRFNRRLYMVSQCDESTLSSASSPSSSYSPASLNQSSYPIETLNDDQLMNASNLPSLNSQNLNLTQHINEISSLNSNKLSQESKTSQLTNETSILDSEDIPLIEILMDLARDSEKHGPVDNDSILGTQSSAFDHEEIKSDNEDDDVIDFNLTCLDIDSMSPWGSNPDKSPPSQLVPVNNIDLINNINNSNNNYNDNGNNNDNNHNNNYNNPGSINTTETTNINRPIIGADTTDVESLNSEESQLPQLDGAGDLLSFLESEEDENIIKYEHQVKRIPEYQAPISTADYANRVRVFNTNLPCNDDEAFIMEEGTSSSNCSPMSQQDAWSFYLPTDADNIDEFVNMNFELLGSEFDSDYETTLGLNSLLEGDEDESTIGINLIVDNGNNECVPLEAVLNGDPCFTQTAEMDKSDLTELKDQYDSLLGSELVPIAYKNFRESDNCVDNNNTRLDRNDKCGQVYSNLQSQQLNNDNTSEEAASTTGTTAITPPTNDTRNLSSENVTPNIQEPDGKVNTIKNKYDNCKEFSSSRELATAADSSDYNCNLVARWEELQDLKFIPKRVLKKKGFVRPRKQILRRATLSESMMARKRGYFRRGPANLANQVFTSDNNNTTTTTVSPVPDNDNLPNNLIDNVNSKKDNTTICNNNRQIRATDRTGTTDKIKLFIENSRNVKNSNNTSTTTASSTCNSTSTSKTRLSADIRATLASTTTTKTSSFGSGIKEKSTKSPCSLDDYSPSALSNFSPSDLIGHVNTSTKVETFREYCNGEMDNLSSVVGNPDVVDNNPTDGEKTKIVDNKHQSRYLSYYSSVNAHSGVPYGQNKHRHCLYSSYRSAFVKDYVFTVDQVWVIDKRKRGTAPAISASLCTKDCCRLPIVLLDKLNIVINKSKPKHTQANRDESSVVIDHVDNVNYTCDSSEIDMVNCNLNIKNIDKINTPAQLVNSYNNDNCNNNNNNNINNNNNNNNLNNNNDDLVKVNNKKNYKDGNNIKKTNILLLNNNKNYDSTSTQSSQISSTQNHDQVTDNNNKIITATTTTTTTIKQQEQQKNDGPVIIKRVFEEMSQDGTASKKKRSIILKLGNRSHSTVSIKDENKSNLDESFNENFVQPRGMKSKRRRLKKIKRLNEKVIANGINKESKIHNEKSTPHIFRSSKSSKSWSSIIDKPRLRSRVNNIVKSNNSNNQLMDNESTDACSVANGQLNLITSSQSEPIQSRKRPEIWCSISRKNIDLEFLTAKSLSSPVYKSDNVPVIRQKPIVIRHVETLPKTYKIKIYSPSSNVKSVCESEVDTTSPEDSLITFQNNNTGNVIDNNFVVKNNNDKNIISNTSQVQQFSEFDTTLDVHLCDSIYKDEDDVTAVANEIFDTAAGGGGGGGGGIVEEEKISLVDCTANSSQESEQYTKAIAEANFYAGKNYTIDAISLEIPQCLFEEDSNSESLQKKSLETITESSMPEISVGILSPSDIPSSHSQETPAELDKLLDNNLINGLNDLNDSISSLTSITDKTVVKSQPMNEFVQPGDSFNSITSHKFNPRDHTSTECNYVSSSSSSSSSSAFEFSTSAMLNNLPSEQLNFEDYFDEEQIIQMINSALILNDINLDDNTLNNQLLSLSKEDNICGDNNSKVDDEKTKTKYSPNKISIIRKIYKSKGDNNKSEKSNNENIGMANQADENLLLNPKQGIDLVDIEAEAPDNPVIIKPNNGIDLEFNEPMKIDGDGDDDNSVYDNDKDADGEEEKLSKFTSIDSINNKLYENQELQNEIKSDCVISQYKNFEKSVDNISSEIFNQNEKNEQQSVKTIPTVCDNENKVNVIDIEVIKLMDNILSLVSIEKSMNNMYNNGNVDNSIDTEPVLNSIVNNNLIDDKGCKAAGGRSNYLSQSNEISTTVTAVENNTDCNKFKGITDKFCTDNKNIIENLEADGSDDDHHHEETEVKLTNEKTDVKLVEPEIKDKITTGTAGSYCEVVEVNEKVKSSVEQSTFESSIPITDNQCSNEQEIKLRFKEDYTEVVFNSDKENIDSHECSIYSNSISEVEKDPEEVVRAEENKEEEEINGDGEEVQEDKLNIDTGSKSGVEQENNYIDDGNGKNISKESVFRCRELSVRLVRIKLNEFNQYLNSSNGCGNKSKIDVNSSLVEFESGGEAANPSSVKQKLVNSSGVKKCVRFDDQVFIFETNTRVPLINFDEKSEEEEEEEEEAEEQRESFTEGDEGEGAVEPECQGEGEGETETVGTGEVEGEGGCDEEESEVLEEEQEEEAEPVPEPEITEQEKKIGVENQELEKEKDQQVEKVKDGEKQDNKNIVDKDEIFVGCMKKFEITESYKSIGNKNDSEIKFNGDVIGNSCINKKHDDDIIVISDSDESSNSDNDVEFVSEEKLVPDSCVSKKLNSKIIDKNFVFTDNNNGNTDKLSHVNVNGVIRNKNETSNDKKNKKYSKSTFKDINPIKDVPRIRSSSFGTVTVTSTLTSTSTSTSTSTISDSCGSSASLPSKKSGKRVKELATKFTCVSGQNSSKSTKTEFNRDIKEQQQFSLDNIQEMESKLDKNLKDVTVLDESTIPVDKNIKEKSRLAVELLTKFSEKEPSKTSESTCKRKRNNNNNLPRQSYLNSNNIIKVNSNSIIVPSTVDPAPTGSSSLLAASMVENRQNSDDNRLVRTYRMLTSYRTKIHTLSIDQRMVFTRVAVSDQEFGSKQAKEKFLEGIGLYPIKPQGCGWKPAHITTGFMQLQQPRVILQRLTPSVLKYYGYTRRFKSQRFGKRFKTDVNNRFTIPAYDGPADLSSTDSESDTDITLDCREKRVCDYKPRKHFKRREAIVTPRKRKNINSDEDTGGDKVNPGEEDLFQGARDRATQRLFNRPTTKHGMPLTDNKIYYQSPTRATTSRSPGLSGNYTPLKIIITSPKVRKLADTCSDQPTIDNHNRTYSHSRAEDCLDNENSCVTPRRRRRLLSSTVTSTKPRGDSCQMLKANDERQQTGEFEILNPIPSTSFGGECSATASNDNNYVEKCNRDLSPSVKANVRKNLFFSSSKKVDRLDKSWRNKAGDIDNTDKGEKLKEDTDEMLNNELEKSSDDDTVIFEQSAANLELEFSPLSKFDDDKNFEEQDDVFNVTFTQYLSSQLTRQTNQSSGEYKKNLSNSEKQVTIIPKLKPPSVERIIDTMELYSIPKYRNLQPFFSNQSDAPGHKEVAHRLLKVPGKGLADLSYFKSSLDNITGINRWRRMKINEFNSSSKGSGGVFKSFNIKKNLAGHSSVVITPLILPPSLTSVIKWVRARDYLAKKRIKLEKRDKDKNNVKDKDKYRDKGIEGGEEEEEEEEIAQDVIETFEQHKKYDNPLIESEQRSNNVNININSSILETTTENIINLNSGSDSSGYTVVDCSSAVEKYTSSGDNGKKSLLIQQHDNENSNNTLGDSLDDYIDPSLLSILGKSKLFKESEQSKHFGISCGQIECLTHSDRSNVENENRQKAKALTRYQFITVLCVEVHVVTRDDLLPDPQHDSISALFYAVQSDVPPTSSIKPLEHGFIAVATEGNNNYGYDYGSSLPFTKTFVSNELELYKAFINLVTRIDPEIFIGWEIESLSWGYIFQRASRLGIDLAKRISRIPSVQCKWESQPSDLNTLADVKLPGRIVLDIWRIMRSEIALLTYTFENVMHSVMNERVPCPSFKVLSNWWIEPQDEEKEEEEVKEPNEKQRQNPRSRWKVVQHYSVKVLGILRILEQLDIIGRTSEHARLFGIQFYEVFSRGSQYRVESIMLRLAKPLNYIPVSPSPLQRASMRAMEALPLIMEPEAMFYSDPLIVLDFQSLYPSIIIAHNYCFSTCLGRIENIGQQNPYKFGAYLLRLPKSTAIKLQGKVNYAPCGVAFVKPEIRLGILPRMLTEILETRLMVKKAMKDHKDSKDDKLLQRVLHSRQHGLKYLANVTYGYTAANFSGRMPCIELGDSVISKAKETLERAIKLVESTPKWGARVVYGDTDSLFILVPGKSKDDAFIIGNEIADAVTASNLKPIKLKFEKVLHPAILQTKKRYCGYMYETPDQKEPTYLAKGIETVRRDGCPAVSKILEKSLKILFDTKDVSLVKQFVTRQLDKVLNGKVSLKDLTFAKEFRGLRGYKEKACVPALELTRRLMKKDPRAIPRHGERVRYVIVAGPPNQALINCVRSPWEVINDPGLRPNGTYYVTRVIIPPLNRCLNLMGVDVNTWYREMPHRYILNNPTVVPSDKQKQTIFQYFGNVVCVCCGRASYKNICDDCTSNSTETIIVLHEKLRWLQRINDNVTAICQSCIGRDSDVADCISLDCPVLYRRAQASRELTQGIQLQNVITGKSHILF